MSRPLPYETRAKALELLAEGIPKSQIARRLKISRRTVLRIAKSSREVLNTEESLAAEIERLELLSDNLEERLPEAKTTAEIVKLTSAIADISAKIGTLAKSYDRLTTATVVEEFKPIEPLPLMLTRSSLPDTEPGTPRDFDAERALIERYRAYQLASQNYLRTRCPLVTVALPADPDTGSLAVSDPSRD